jgi:hypothetical protein
MGANIAISDLGVLLSPCRSGQRRFEQEGNQEVFYLGRRPGGTLQAHLSLRAGVVKIDGRERLRRQAERAWRSARITNAIDESEEAVASFLQAVRDGSMTQPPVRMKALRRAAISSAVSA